ncbi:hypothetical protein K470DRAFT_276011 [Piedraia hortae CBS 480.64]|uniref:S-adenosyl-L-methionine-dependent methyltransferase n=1 Tax=Piedraia hortae CBS 480.64 TaxID=1314780 RepID=A0A6A7C3I7_9PEZI|nr:hypothetical protein K470DRAFT_276011 [Piedraia hortae CBS 480.64]
MPDFNPSHFLSTWPQQNPYPTNNDFQTFITKIFSLPQNDTYIYLTQNTGVTLSQVQQHINYGSVNGLCTWYYDSTNSQRAVPTPSEIEAYNTIFFPGTSTPKSLKNLSSNAKKGSLRAEIGEYLNANYTPPPAGLTVPKTKHVNPYLDVWIWTNRFLLWAGPEPGTVRVRHSHAILPVLYHHFGCVCPSFEALEVIRVLARGRRVIDLGSGGGYWSFMLRERGLNVVAVDSGESEWRFMWVSDTVVCEGERWLKRNGGVEDVLLMVYPIVGQGFTERMVRAFRGTTIITAGTQNASGFTGFGEQTMAEWMEKETKGWKKLLQIPLPSFAGRDEALFVFEKGGRG